VSVIKHTDPVPDPRAVNQDKKNMLFSVSQTSYDCCQHIVCGIMWLMWLIFRVRHILLKTVIFCNMNTITK